MSPPGDRKGKGRPRKAEKSDVLLIEFPYSALEEVAVHPNREDRFVLTLSNKRGKGIPDVLKFSTVWRKYLLENLQACHNSRMILDFNKVDPLPIRFQAEKKKGKPFFRHPVEEYYHRLPFVHKGEGMKCFHRAGYVFLLPRYYVDKHELLPNRPCSTYFRMDEPKNSFEEEIEVNEAGPKAYLKQKRKEHLIVRMLPTRSLTDECHVLKERDMNGFPNPQDILSFQPEMVSKPILASNSELDFYLWTEAVAKAIALEETRNESEGTKNKFGRDYFVSSAGEFRKKMNVVGDKTQWLCFRMHILTKHREIGVIGVRRKFLPPFLDCYQDMIFILYSQFAVHFQPAPRFMNKLEMVVNSVSPVVAPLPFREYIQREKLRGMSTSEETLEKYRVGDNACHRTYYDLTILKARANMLSMPADLWRWLYNKRNVSVLDEDPLEYERLNDKKRLAKSTRTPDTGTLGARATLYLKLIKTVHPYGGLREVTPRTKFIDKECYLLAAIFCQRILKLADAGDEGTQDVVAAEIKNPLTLVSRMQSGYGPEEDKARELGSASVSSPEDEWRARLAQYLAVAVDATLYPARARPYDPVSGQPRTGRDSDLTLEWKGTRKEINIDVIVEMCRDTKSMTRENKCVLDCIVDFLLFMKPKPPPPRPPPLPPSTSPFPDLYYAKEMDSKLVIIYPPVTDWIFNFPHEYTFTPSSPSINALMALLPSPSLATSPATSSASTAALSSTVEGESADVSKAQSVTETLTKTYDYTFVPNVLYKLRAPNLLKWFTCNEDVLCRLLLTDYFETLEQRERQVPSLLPFLLCAVISNMSYNLSLLKVACQKVIDNKLDDLVLINPLIDLCKHGNLYSKIYAFRCLASFADRRLKFIEKAGALGLAIWHIYVAKAPHLIEACTELLVNSIPAKGPIPRQLKNINFAKQLVQLLRTRVRGQERYHNRLLAIVASLMRKLAGEKMMLDVFLDFKADDELIKIMAGYDSVAGFTLEDAKRGLKESGLTGHAAETADFQSKSLRTTFRYKPILLQITGAIATMYLYAGTHLVEKQHVDRYEEHASQLVLTLKKYNYAEEYLQLCWNILTALKYLINPKLLDPTQKDFHVRVERHLAVWRRLEEQDDFGNGLQQTLDTTNTFLKKARELRDDELAEMIRVSKDMKRKISWMQHRLDKGKLCKWSAKELVKSASVHDLEKWLQTPKKR